MRIDIIGSQVHLVPETKIESRMLQVALIVTGNGRVATLTARYGLDRETVVIERAMEEVSCVESSQ
jgi:hypothetical protein